MTATASRPRTARAKAAERPAPTVAELAAALAELEHSLSGHLVVRCEDVTGCPAEYRSDAGSFAGLWNAALAEGWRECDGERMCPEHTARWHQRIGRAAADGDFAASLREDIAGAGGDGVPEEIAPEGTAPEIPDLLTEVQERAWEAFDADTRWPEDPAPDGSGDPDEPDGQDSQDGAEGTS